MLPIAIPIALLGKPAAAAAIAVGAFVAGFCLEIFAVGWDTTMQQEIPGEMLSRVYSYDMLGSIALVPLGLAVDRPGRRRDRHAGDALRHGRADRARDAPGLPRPRRPRAQTTVSVFSSRASR